jgi:hypothetical protein
METGQLIGNKGREAALNRKVCASMLGLVFLATGFLMSCSSTSVSPPPQNIVASDGTPQGATIGTPFGAPLQATVTAGGSGVGLAAVTFTVVPSSAGAGATFSNGTGTETDMTSSSGVVFSSTLTAGTILALTQWWPQPQARPPRPLLT